MIAKKINWKKKFDVRAIEDQYKERLIIKKKQEINQT